MRTTRDPQVHADMIDRLLEHYCAWKEECTEVQAAYRRFSSASVPDRALAYAAYVAALDREDAAAWMYAIQVDLVSSRVSPEPHGDATLPRGYVAIR